MTAAIRGVMVVGHESLIDAVALPDPEDRARGCRSGQGWCATHRDAQPEGLPFRGPGRAPESNLATAISATAAATRSWTLGRSTPTSLREAVAEAADMFPDLPLSVDLTRLDAYVDPAVA
jgi:hypothetical protein